MNVFEKIVGETFWLAPERCVFWEEENAIIVSDLHFGKTGHFRKAGIAIPQTLYKQDLLRLFAAIQFHRPAKLIIVGDLFHSKENKELEFFKKWRQDIPGVEVILVKGNHDILKDSWYEASGITVYHEKFLLKNICFTHDISLSTCNEENVDYYFTGHIHPRCNYLWCWKANPEFSVFLFYRKICSAASVQPFYRAIHGEAFRK